MKPNEDRPESDESAEHEAAGWIVPHDRGMTPEQHEEFLKWLSSSDKNRAAFQEHQQLWKELDALARCRPKHGTVPDPDLLAGPRRSKFRRWWAPAALAAAACLALALWVGRTGKASAFPALALDAPAYRHEVLSDGSELDLNRGTHVIVQFSPAERRITLVEGEARFTVAKEAARPFIVRYDGIEVKAVGTVFNVKLTGPELEVLVTEGKVEVAKAPEAHSSQSSREDQNRRSRHGLIAEISAAERTVIPLASPGASPRVTHVSKQEIEDLLVWRPTLLSFDSTPLVEVIDAFNRRNSRQLVIMDKELNDMPIVASIRSDNVAGFLRLLEATMGVRAEDLPDGGIALRRAR